MLPDARPTHGAADPASAVAACLAPLLARSWASKPSPGGSGTQWAGYEGTEEQQTQGRPERGQGPALVPGGAPCRWRQPNHALREDLLTKPGLLVPLNFYGQAKICEFHGRSLGFAS